METYLYITFIFFIGSLVQSWQSWPLLHHLLRRHCCCYFCFSLCFPFCFDLLDALKVASFISGFYCSILISYVVNIPCSSSMLIEFRSDLSYNVDILGLNIIGRDLSTFWTITYSLISSPNPMIAFIVSSTHKT